MKNLTEGSPLRLSLGFIGPLLFGLMFQQLYAMTDLMIVGKLLGTDALAGVGSTGSICFFVLGFCNGVCAGFAIPVAQKFGQQDLKGLRQITGNVIWLCSILAAVMTVSFSLLCGPILRWMHTPAVIFPLAFRYLIVIFLGIPATILYTTVSSILQALGDSKIPLYFLIFSSLLNIALDFALILLFPMGVVGAAVATVFSQLLAGALCLVYMLRRYEILRLGREDWKLRRDVSLHLLGMGIPAGLQYSITAIGTILVQSAINTLGPVVMAAVSACDRAFGMLGTPTTAIGMASATIAGQNIGAAKLDRVHRFTLCNFLLGLAYCVLALLFVLLCGRPLISLFLNPADPELTNILDLGQQYMRINTLSIVTLLTVNLFRFTIQGMGFSTLSVGSGILELVARALIALGLVPRFGFLALCFASPAAWLLATLFLIPAYLLKMRHLRRMKERIEFRSAVDAQL